jgi:hypothetical protein
MIAADEAIQLAGRFTSRPIGASASDRQGDRTS